MINQQMLIYPGNSGTMAAPGNLMYTHFYHIKCLKRGWLKPHLYCLLKPCTMECIISRPGFEWGKKLPIEKVHSSYFDAKPGQMPYFGCALGGYWPYWTMFTPLWMPINDDADKYWDKLPCLGTPTQK